MTWVFKWGKVWEIYITCGVKGIKIVIWFLEIDQSETRIAYVC
jgi:hypothetical protein